MLFLIVILRLLFRSFKPFFKNRLRLLGRTPPPLESRLEEEHAEKGVEEGKEEPKSAAESLDRTSKGVY